MLYNIRQTNRRLLPEIKKWGCLFLCFAYSSPMIFAGEEGEDALNNIWREAVSRGFISGDLNGDGDADDDGESEVRDHDGLCSLFALGCRYDGLHHKAAEVPTLKVRHVFGCYRWRGTHFVVLDRERRVVYDPMGVSETVRNGKLESMRWYAPL